MRLRSGALLILLLAGVTPITSAQVTAGSSSSPGFTRPVRVRWILDIKKKLGYDAFDRIQSQDNSWKSQQGIAFLGADELALYQVNRTETSTVNYNMQIEILDAKDGHELKRLSLPISAEFARLIPTHKGGFLIHAQDEIRLYSPKFEPVATRKLPGGKEPGSNDWEVDVSPSGTQVILAHHQSSDVKGKEDNSNVDIEVLDAEGLKSIKAFSITNLDEWSAGDSAIITKNPENEDALDYGILDFDGRWRAIKTSAGSGDPDCPYRMEPLEHELLVAHDCDDVVVITKAGREKFSQPVSGPFVLASVAGADRYLAEALVEPEHSHAYISVYDVPKRRQILWLSLEKKTIYFSLSPAGTVAAVDGERLKFFEPVEDQAAVNPKQRWSVELGDTSGYESFDRGASPPWMRQQDVRFITPDEIAVYQVRRVEQASLTERDTSGGAGNFFLQLGIFSARDGHAIKSLRLPTNAQFTKVIPTHDGKFLVRTGDVLSVYSADFQPFASRSLALDKIEGAEGWQIDVTPSGTAIVLAHQKRFAAKSVLVGEQASAAKDHADIEVVNADTLQPTQKFTVKFLRDNWSAEEHSLVTSSPDQADKAFGLLDFAGKWSELKTPWENTSSLCPLQMQALPQDRVAAAGCRFFGVVSMAGEQILGLKLDAFELSIATNGAGPFVAVEIDKFQPGKPISASRPDRIEVYDLRTKARVTTVPLSAENPYFDVSSQGELVVVEGDHVSLYSAAGKQDSTAKSARDAK